MTPLNIATCAQEYFRKPLSITTVCCCIKKCNLISVTRGESYTSNLYAAMLPGSLGQSSSQIVKNSGNVCCTQMSPHFNLFSGKMDFEFSVPMTKGTIQTFISDRCKSKRLSWYMSAHNASHPCCGTIEIQRYILPSRWCLWRQFQLLFCMCYNSVVS